MDCFPPLPRFDAPARGNPLELLEYWMKLTPQKLEGWGYRMVKIHNPNFLTSTVFYRAMHFSAKRSIAIACRLSVRLSVCDVGEL